jgi:hypothetical protein
MTGEKELNGRMNGRVFGVKRSKCVGDTEQNNPRNPQIPKSSFLKFQLSLLTKLLIFPKSSSGDPLSTPRLQALL